MRSPPINQINLSWSEPEVRGEWASTPAFHTQVQRLADGAFRSDARLVQMPLLRISVEHLQSAPLRVIGQIAGDYANVCIAEGSQATLNGVSLHKPSLHILGAGSLFDSTMGATWCCRLLHLSRGVLRSKDDPLHSWFDNNASKQGVLHAPGHRLSDLIMTLTRQAETDPDGLTAIAQDLLVDDVVAALRDAVDATPESVSDLLRLGATSRRRLALAAEEWIRTGIGDESLLSIEALCRELNASPRLLQMAFQEQFGTSARTFVLSARIQKAHAMLVRKGDKITLSEIAAQSGLWHLGRFSQYYRQFFGCTPSTMQRKIWGSSAQTRAT
jgi:AraC-like DNA-binding protein